MYTLFDEKERFTLGSIKPGYYEYLIRLYNETRDKLYNYYFQREDFEKNSNPLVRLVEFLEIKGINTIYDMLEHMDLMENYATRQFDIISNFTRGDVKDMTFILAYHYSNYFELTDWRKIEAVRYIEIDIPNVGMLHPKDLRGEISTVAIDLRALAIQYMLWKNYRLSNGVDISVRKFIMNVVYTTMISSHTALSFFHYIFKDSEILRLGRHPIDTMDLTSITKYYVKALRKEFKKRRARYSLFIQNCRVPFYEDIGSVLRKDYGLVNLYNEYYIWYLQSKYVIDILEFDEYKSAKYNTILFRDIKNGLRQAGMQKFFNFKELEFKGNDAITVYKKLDKIYKDYK